MKIGQTILVKSICLFLCFFKGDLDFLRLEALAFLFLSPVLPDFSIPRLGAFLFLYREDKGKLLISQSWS